MTSARILIVEDERIVAEDLKETLKNFGYVVVDSVVTGESAITRAQELKPDLVMMDIFLAGKIDGIQAADEIKKTCDIPVIYLTAYADEKILSRARITEPYGYILKPYDEREIRTVIEIALYKHHLDGKLKESEERYRLFVENFLGIAYRTSGDGTPLFYHGIAKSITGYTTEDLTALAPAWKSLIHADDLPAIVEQDRQLASTPGTVIEREYRILHKDRTYRWVFELARSGGSKDSDDVVIQGAIYDITSRKRAEDGLKKRDTILMAIGSAVEWFLREPLMLKPVKGKTSVHGDIGLILEQMGMALDISSVAIFSFSPDYAKISLADAWVDPADPSRKFGSPLNDIPFSSAANPEWAAMLRKGLPASGLLQEPDAKEEKILYTAFGFRSAGFVPLIIRDTVWGFIGFLDREQREWDAEEMEGLRIVANIISVILQQQNR